jgi:hypothetical protein
MLKRDNTMVLVLYMYKAKQWHPMKKAPEGKSGHGVGGHEEFYDNHPIKQMEQVMTEQTIYESDKGDALFTPKAKEIGAETGLAIKKVRHIENLLHLGESPKRIKERLGLNRFEYSHLVRISRKLAEPVKDILVKSKLSEGHARALTSLGHAQQEETARNAIARRWSVRRLEQEVRALLEGKQVNEDSAYYENLGERISSIIGHPVKVIPSKNDQSTGMIQITYLGYDAFDGIMARMRVKLEEDY